MKTADFVAAKRPNLAAFERFPHVDFSDYERRLRDLQVTLQRVQQAYLGTPQRAVIVLEGWDTAGKGGVVRRLGWALDPHSFKVHTIAAPGEREKSLHYLQRFWERLPHHGQIVAFDRSWYGRVLVERVEGFATAAEWGRAYEEINKFERMMLADGVRLVKLFLHITADEQMRRFRNRLTNPLKRWKLSYEDFRNRGHWKDYETAIEDMIAKISAGRAPFTSFQPMTSRMLDWRPCVSLPTACPRTARSSRRRSTPRSSRQPSTCWAFASYLARHGWPAHGAASSTHLTIGDRASRQLLSHTDRSAKYSEI